MHAIIITLLKLNRSQRGLGMKKFGKVAAVAASVTMVGNVALPAVSVSAASTGKTINWSEVAALPTMDPAKSTDTVSADALGATSLPLLQFGKGGELENEAAKSYEKSDDGLTYTFHLRSGLKWENGDDLTAKDFVYGWQRSIDPKTASEYAYLLDSVKNAKVIEDGDMKPSALGIEAIDDQTLKVTLESPASYFLQELTMPVFFPENQKFVEAKGNKFGTSAANYLSAGPYKFKGWSGSNNKYSYVKNNKYYDADKVKTKKIAVQTIKDQNTGYNLYQGKKLDFTPLSPDQVKASKSKKGYKEIKSGATQALQMNQEKVPEFKNTKIRQAISYAVNRKALSNQIVTGSAIPATTYTPKGLVKNPNNNKDFATDAEVKGAVGYDKKKAAKLFKAGLKEVDKSKLSVQLLTDDDDTSKRVAQFLQEQLEKNLDGMDVSIKTVPKKQRLKLSTDGDFQMLNFGWLADYPDASSFLDLYKADASYNYGKWQNEDYNAALESAEGKNANDKKAQYADFKKAEQILEKEAGVAPLYYRSTASLLNPKVKGVVANPTGAPFNFKYAVKH